MCHGVRNGAISTTQWGFIHKPYEVNPNGKNYGDGNGVCSSLGAVHEIRGIKVLIIRKNMFLQFRNAFKESFMDCSPIMSHEQSGKSRHGFVSSTF